jgi:uncharacterized membrane protein YjgN (DUF898 family)
MNETLVTTADAEIPEAEERQAISNVAFTGKALPLFKLLLKNIVLTILTLGIYRFWAKTWLRRYFWNNVTIEKEPFEYTGQPKELFMGFLIALAVLVPFGIFDNYSASLVGSYPNLQIPYSIAFYSALYLLIQFAFYRMWRYRMTRTAWRGIHFGLDGTARKFVALSLFWTVITILTLGLASPWSRTALARYRINNSHFGDSYFSFYGSGKDLIFPWMIAYAIPITLIVTWGWMNFEQAAEILNATQVNPGESISIDGLKFAGIPWFAGFIFPLLFIWYKAREFRYFVNSTQLGDITLSSKLSTGTVVGLFVATYLLVSIAIPLFVLPPVFIFGEMPTLSSVHLSFIAAFIVLLLIVPLLTQGFLRYQLTKLFCRQLSINETSKLEAIAQSTRPAPERGEGFADALDVGAI